MKKRIFYTIVSLISVILLELMFYNLSRPLLGRTVLSGVAALLFVVLVIDYLEISIVKSTFYIIFINFLSYSLSDIFFDDTGVKLVAMLFLAAFYFLFIKKHKET